MPRLTPWHHCHDIVCLTETWLTEYDAQLVVPKFTCHSACRPVRDGLGRPAGGVSVYVSDRLHMLSLSKLLQMAVIFG